MHTTTTGPRLPRRGLLRMPLAAALAALLWAGAATAQQDRRVDVTGRVVDARSGQPVRGALVELGRPRLTAITDSLGQFTLARVRPGAKLLAVSALGYEEVEVQTDSATTGPMRIPLAPKPLVLEGLSVSADRFQARRSAYPGSVRVIDRQQMRGSSAPDLLTLLRQRSTLTLTRCPSRIGSECLLVRGRPVMPRVYLDESPMVGGLRFLESFDPYEFEVVEIYGNGSQIRLYSTAYMERAAKGGWAPEPLRI